MSVVNQEAERLLEKRGVRPFLGRVKHKWFVSAALVVLMVGCSEADLAENSGNLDQVDAAQVDGGQMVAEKRGKADEIVIYSPAPAKIMMHAHNVELGDTLAACGIQQKIRVIPVALPESINLINQLDPSEKPYHLPIVTTLDYRTAIENSAPEWHGYSQPNSDLRFVASLYDVTFGLLSVNPKVRKPEDLAGMRIALPARPSAVRWFTEVLLRDGWGLLEEVTLVDMAPPQVPAAVANGEVDLVAWNIMSETRDGYQPLLPSLLQHPDAHWLNVDSGTVDAINAANPFATERVEVRLGDIIGVDKGNGRSVGMLSFRQALAAWDTTPDQLVSDIVACMSQTTLSFGTEAAFSERQFHWPDLMTSEIHPAAKSL